MFNIIISYLTLLMSVNCLSWVQHNQNIQQTCAVPKDENRSSIRAFPYISSKHEELYSDFFGAPNDQAIVTNEGIAYYITQQNYLTALNLTDDEVSWSEATLPNIDGLSSNPTYDEKNNLLYIFGTGQRNNLLNVFNAESGNYLWGETRNISGTVTYFPIYNPFSNMIVVASCNPITATTFIYSLNVSTEEDHSNNNTKIYWSQESHGYMYNSYPAISPNGQSVYVVLYNGSLRNSHQDNILLISYDSYTGEQQWNQSINELTAMTVTSLIVRYDGVVVISDPKHTYLIDPQNTSNYITITNFRTLAVAHNNDMFGIGLHWDILAKYTSTGQILWSNSIGLTHGISIDGDSIIYASVQGIFDMKDNYVFGIDYNKGNVLWSLQVTKSSDKLGTPVIVGDGTLLVISDNSLLRIGCCNGKGSCASNDSCLCDTNYYGNDCSVFCSNESCGISNSKCNDLGQCVCKDDYFPPQNCSSYCNLVQCTNERGINAFCNEDGDCICKPNYYGENCDRLCVNGNYESDSDSCSCRAPYVGPSCETSSEEIPKNSRMVVVIAVVSFIFVVTVIIVIIAYLVAKRARKGSSYEKMNLENAVQ